MTESTKFISCDLLNESRDYYDFYNLLDTFRTHHKITNSLWMVTTSLSTEEVRDKFAECLDDFDRFFVISYASDSISAWHNCIEDFKNDLVRGGF